MQFRFQSNEIQGGSRGFCFAGSVLAGATVSQLGFRFRLEREEKGDASMRHLHYHLR